MLLWTSRGRPDPTARRDDVEPSYLGSRPPAARHQISRAAAALSRLRASRNLEASAYGRARSWMHRISAADASGRTLSPGNKEAMRPGNLEQPVVISLTNKKKPLHVATCR